MRSSREGERYEFKRRRERCSISCLVSFLRMRKCLKAQWHAHSIDNGHGLEHSFIRGEINGGKKQDSPHYQSSDILFVGPRISRSSLLLPFSVFLSFSLSLSLSCAIFLSFNAPLLLELPADFSSLGKKLSWEGERRKCLAQ